MSESILSNPALIRAMTPKWTRFIPHSPTPKQRAFLCLPHREAFFGGAAGGGKSDALLMAVLQYVDVPGYAALILRKTLTDLKQAGALLFRAQEWLNPWLGHGVSYIPNQHTYRFETEDPSRPATVQFGYIGDEMAFERYQGIEIQTCCFDELTQHSEQDYLYLFSRLRKNACRIHGSKIEQAPNGQGGTFEQAVPNYVDGCKECAQQKSIPIRMRSASNPTGHGRLWVRRRFKIEPDIDPIEARKTGKTIRFVGQDPKRPFIPSFVKDNPYLNQAAYLESLDELPELERKQLKEGDWAASSDSRFKAEWARYYTVLGDHFILGDDFRGPTHYRASLRRVFSTVDPAGSSKEGPGAEDVWKAPKHSNTVISTFGLTVDFNLIWLDMVQFQKEIPDINHELKASYRKWRQAYFIIEANGLGAGVFQLAQRAGLPVKAGYRHTDKVVNATDAILRMEQGRIWLPRHATWRRDVEDEIFTWFGHPKQTDDIVDTLADACKDVSWEAAVEEASEETPEIVGDDMPDVVRENFPSMGFSQSDYPQDFGNVFVPLQSLQTRR